MNKENKLKILDCTFRDGGYYNNWNFNSDLVAKYLNAIALSNVDIVEMGFRTPLKNKFFGPYAYCTDSFLSTLPLPQNAVLGVMINGKEFIDNDQVNLQQVDLHFDLSANSPVDFIRLACHYKEISCIAPLLESLKKKGYKLGLNLMQSSIKTPQEIAETVKMLASYGSLDVLYFADSLGNMNPMKVKEIIGIIKQVWNGQLGIHTHNNMGNALVNSMMAIECGVTWIDGTILGMGRGAGNVRTEYLLLELQNKAQENYYPEALFPLVLGNFSQLQDQYGWGPNLMYYLSALHNIHPTFIQEMLTKYKNDPHKLLDAVTQLKTNKATSYNLGMLHDALKIHHQSSKGDWNPKSLIDGREVLLLGSGPTLGEHTQAINDYIDRHSPIVLSLNINQLISHDRITAYTACHPMRLLLDSEKYRSLKKPIIVPKGSLPAEIVSKMNQVEIFNYGLVQGQACEIQQTHCVLPIPLVIAYTLALCSAGGAKRILFAGFDGYSSEDPCQDEMEEILNMYKKHPLSKPIVAVTPTTYNITQSTIYSPYI